MDMSFRAKEEEEEKEFAVALLRANRLGHKVDMTDPRLKDFLKLAKILRKEVEAAEKKREADYENRSAENKRRADERCKALRERIDVLELSDFIKVGVQNNRCNGHEIFYEVYAYLERDKFSRDSEADTKNATIDKLLSKLERRGPV